MNLFFSLNFIKPTEKRMTQSPLSDNEFLRRILDHRPSHICRFSGPLRKRESIDLSPSDEGEPDGMRCSGWHTNPTTLRLNFRLSKLLSKLCHIILKVVILGYVWYWPLTVICWLSKFLSRHNICLFICNRWWYSILKADIKLLCVQRFSKSTTRS